MMTDPAPTVLDGLLQLLALEALEENLYRGQSQDLGWGAVFGGQVLGQALSAATRTVSPERLVHSLHAYFLRPGDVRRPIVYNVDRIRDGNSFTTRRVVAVQGGQAIFNLAASFQVDEPGFEHQDRMPAAPPPETLKTEREHAEEAGLAAPRGGRPWIGRPFEMRPVEPPLWGTAPPPQPPARMVWLRADGRVPDDPTLHRTLLAYASDHSFITTALRPHGVSFLTPGMQIASLDHVMWFHAAFRVDDWLLHVIESPAAHGGRALVRGRIFAKDGRLVASSAQEGLIRRRGAEELP
jgi:acyl-CoA thioesterase-2